MSSQARTTGSRRFSDADQAAIAFGRLFVSDNHDEVQQTQNVSDRTGTPPLPRSHTCSTAECLITKVLETTELLELVLSFLGTSDILKLRFINRKWDDITRTSPLLRLHHFVNPQWKRHPEDYELLDLNLPGFAITPGESVYMGRWLEVTMTGAAARQVCPSGGSRSRALSVHEGLRGLRRAREMLSDVAQRGQQSRDTVASQLQRESLYVIQPPIVGLQAFTVGALSSNAGTSNGSLPRMEPRAIAKIHCDTGITLGFLAEAVHRLLRDAGEEDWETKQVLFKAIVSFASPDAKPKSRDGRRSIVRL